MCAFMCVCCIFLSAGLKKERKKERKKEMRSIARAEMHIPHLLSVDLESMDITPRKKRPPPPKS